MSVNKVILIGNLGQDPEKKVTPSGQTVVNFSVATSKRWTAKDGQKQERTDWHRVVVWGPQANACAQYLAKGRQVYVECELQTRSWDDKTDGKKRYATEVVANRVQFLGQGAGKGEGASTGAAAGGWNQGVDNGSTPGFESEQQFDDVPF